jgi:hypothetical protein
VKVLACMVVLLAAFPSKAADLHSHYVGKSGCSAEFKSSINDYGIRLDKSKDLRLEAHALKDKTIVSIVQYLSNSDRCGVVRDAIGAERPATSFVWECFDKTAPGKSSSEHGLGHIHARRVRPYKLGE